MKLIQRSCAVFALGLALLIPASAHAGGNQGQAIARFAPLKSPKDVDELKPDSTVVKVCRGCGMVTLVRVLKGGKGVYDYVAKKCEDCGSEDTYLAVSKSPVPFKEQIKR
jgi:hypothetical protein